MDSVKLYVTEDGKEYTFGERLIINDIRYLLLYNQTDDESSVAYEKDGNLYFIDQNYPNYDDILKKLFDKVNASE